MSKSETGPPPGSGPTHGSRLGTSPPLPQISLGQSDAVGFGVRFGTPSLSADGCGTLQAHERPRCSSSMSVYGRCFWTCSCGLWSRITSSGAGRPMDGTRYARRTELLRRIDDHGGDEGALARVDTTQGKVLLLDRPTRSSVDRGLAKASWAAAGRGLCFVRSAGRDNRSPPLFLRLHAGDLGPTTFVAPLSCRGTTTRLLFTRLVAFEQRITAAGTSAQL